MTAVVACEPCGTGLRENAKFCDKCGAPIAVSGDTAEYKQVTLLFADVVRSMGIAAALDIERLREAAVLRRYGGTVEHHDDGVMAISAPQCRWRITYFAHVWPSWPSKRRQTGWRPRYSTAMV